MTPPPRSLVHRILSFHLGICRDAIRDTQRLGPDLGLDSFDLVHVGLWFEEIEPDLGEFPARAIDPRMTVGELAALFQAWLDGDDLDDLEDEEAADTLRTPRASVPPPTLRSRDVG